MILWPARSGAFFMHSTLMRVPSTCFMDCLCTGLQESVSLQQQVSSPLSMFCVFFITQGMGAGNVCLHHCSLQGRHLQGGHTQEDDGTAALGCRFVAIRTFYIIYIFSCVTPTCRGLALLHASLT